MESISGNRPSSRISKHQRVDGYSMSLTSSAPFWLLIAMRSRKYTPAHCTESVLTQHHHQPVLFSAIICTYEQYSVCTMYAARISSSEEGPTRLWPKVPPTKNKKKSADLFHFLGAGSIQFYFLIFAIKFIFIFRPRGRAWPICLPSHLVTSLLRKLMENRR